MSVRYWCANQSTGEKKKQILREYHDKLSLGNIWCRITYQTRVHIQHDNHWIKKNKNKMSSCMTKFCMASVNISLCPSSSIHVNTWRLRQNGWDFPDDIFKCIFLNENICISNTTWLKFVPGGPVDNNTALIQIMAWHWTGYKPLSEPMMA